MLRLEPENILVGGSAESKEAIRPGAESIGLVKGRGGAAS
jgi:hypothetical protein